MIVARINEILAVDTLVVRRALAAECFEVREASGVVIARPAGTVIDLCQAILTGETRWTVATIVGAVHPVARSVVATGTGGSRDDGLAECLRVIVRTGENIYEERK